MLTIYKKSSSISSSPSAFHWHRRATFKISVDLLLKHNYEGQGTLLTSIENINMYKYMKIFKQGLTNKITEPKLFG